jgi:deazaflavin-dependent oxidoreductase (nitroreductase family)
MSTADLTPEAADTSADRREAALREAPKHGRLLKSARDGKVLSAIMLPFYGFATAPGHGVLTTIGRRSGTERRKCIRAIRRGNKAYVVMLRPPAAAIENPNAVAAWVLNIRANPSVRLKLGRRTYQGIAREITDPAELEAAREAICETVHLIDYGECDLHLRGLPTRSKIKELHRYWLETGVAIVIDLAGAAK